MNKELTRQVSEVEDIELELRKLQNAQNDAVAQMREEQAEAIRRRTLFRWIAVPCLIASLAGSLLLDRSEHAVLAYASDLVASGAAWVLWRSNRERLRDLLGR